MRCEVCPGAQCRQLGPDHILGDPFPADKCAEAAIDSGDHALAVADRRRDRLDPLRHHLRMFDKIALRIDNPGDQGQIVGQLAAT